jgi:hypothetical protein
MPQRAAEQVPATRKEPPRKRSWCRSGGAARSRRRRSCSIRRSARSGPQWRQPPRRPNIRTHTGDGFVRRLVFAVCSSSRRSSSANHQQPGQRSLSTACARVAAQFHFAQAGRTKRFSPAIAIRSHDALRQRREVGGRRVAAGTCGLRGFRRPCRGRSRVFGDSTDSAKSTRNCGMRRSSPLAVCPPAGRASTRITLRCRLLGDTERGTDLAVTGVIVFSRRRATLSIASSRR